MTTARPIVLLEGYRSAGTYGIVRAKSPHVQAPRCQSSDLAHRVEGDHRDARFIEDAMLHLHHLYGSPIPASDLGGQFLPEDRHLFAIRRAIMRGEVALSTVLTAVRSKPEHVRKLACVQP